MAVAVLKNPGFTKASFSLKAAGVEYVELSGVQPNPRLSLVNEGIKLCREKNIKFVLAVGGGSVIDSAKAIAMGVPYNGMFGISLPEKLSLMKLYRSELF